MKEPEMLIFKQSFYFSQLTQTSNLHFNFERVIVIFERFKASQYALSIWTNMHFMNPLALN